MSAATNRAASQQRSREITAHHEAGHVVVALALGLPVTSVSIEALGSSLGRFSMPVPDEDWGPLEPEDVGYFESQIVVLFAGPFAERRHGHSRCWRSHGCNDFSSAADLLDHLDCLPGSRRARVSSLQQRADLLVERRWPAICHMAHMLLEVNRLEGAELLEVFRQAADKSMSLANMTQSDVDQIAINLYLSRLPIERAIVDRVRADASTDALVAELGVSQQLMRGLWAKRAAAARCRS
jgi:hypothetical protein